ncbi:MAG: DUF177 domain-containing protein [Chloroflexus sp.]
MTTLRFNLAQLLREEMGARRDISFSEPALQLDDELTLRNISGRLRLTRTAAGVYAQVTVHGIVTLTCVRSLEPFDYELDLDFSDQFYAVVDVVNGHRLPQPSEDDPFMLDELHHIDIGEAIRSYALINLPMNPVAPAYRDQPVNYTVESEGLNEDDSLIDDRFAALRKWAERQRNQN